jgi:glycine betaine/proline transport system ATP-binding protein
LLPHKTILENAAFGLELRGDPREEREAKGMKALETVGLQGYEEQYPSELSGGMQQRVGLARALANDTDVLLMDEAFSALDPLIRRDMQDELLDLHDRLRKTIVFISHDLDEAIKLGDRIVLMKDGAIVQEGTAEEILTNPANEYVARFVEDVDMSKIITAESVMKRAVAVAEYPGDGPKAALRKMEKAGISSIFVRQEHHLKGLVTAQDAARAARRGDKHLDSILRRDIARVSPETPAIELFPLLAESSFPVAVVDADNRLRGVVIKGSLLAGIAATLQTEDSTG